MTYDLLDLFCGAGGAGYGYYLAGFRVTGVDIKPQPRYPFRFIQGDALEYLAARGSEYDAIHASPPCQAYSRMRRLPWVRKDHPELIEPVRALLCEFNVPWVIENVEGAPLDGITLCGWSLGQRYFKHRVFESNMVLLSPAHVKHAALHPGARRMSQHRFDQDMELIGCDWMTVKQRRDAIPPAYTELIGRQLLPS